jgi:hypothetical protein
MIFGPDLLPKVLDGSKTVTRRRMHRKPLPDGRTRATCPYVKGRTYAVQAGRGQKAVGRILVTDNWPVLLGTLNQRESRKEGFRNPRDFVAYWTKLYGDCDPSEWVWRIEFELVQS